MSELEINATKITPRVYLNYENNIFEIIGRSIPSNSNGFYEKIIKWLGENLKADKKIEFIIHMDYFNTSTNKSIIDIIDLIHEINPNNMIIWRYDLDDEEMKEIGMQMQFLSSAKIVFQEITT